MITHENILHNIRQINAVEECSHADALISWLPPYHDMGLIHGIILPLYVAAQAHLMSPMDFLKNPKTWLQQISSVDQSVVSVAPSFAYKYCVKKIAESDRDDPDLSRWKLAVNGAEPIRAATIRGFSAAFATAGFSPKAFFPGYGLAEATLFVSGSRPGMGPTIISVSRTELLSGKVVAAEESGGKAQELVGSGLPTDEVIIVSPSDRVRLPPNRIGEIYHSGKSVAQGYWNRQADTAEIFNNFFPGYSPHQRFLKTGDLGFIDDKGELFITGRIKDLIIINGVNHYPQDIESTISHSHELITVNACICFSVAAQSSEKLVAVCETSARTQRTDGPAIIASIIRLVGLEHGLPLHQVVLIRPKKIPKTTSGKLQRSKCKDLFENGLLEAVYTYRAEDVDADSRSENALRSTRETTPADGLRISEWIISWIKKNYASAPAAISGEAQFAEFGIDSLAIIDLALALEKKFDIDLEPAVVIDHPTPHALGLHIAQTFATRTLHADQDATHAGARANPAADMDEDLKNDVVHKVMKKLQADRILGLNSVPVSDRPNYFVIREISDTALLGFQSCSYLNLEWHPLLQQKAIEAIVRHGTQFSCSRAFVSVASYQDLSRMLHQIFGMPPVISASTPLGHLSALPALIRRDDIIVMDEQAHNSMQMAARLCTANGTALYKCRHGDMDMLGRIVQGKLPGKSNRTWYLADGLYSMRGDFIDMESLFALMGKFPSLHAYIDDAHSFGWMNEHGCGHVARYLHHPQFERIVLAGSLSKAFAAGGGCLLTRNEAFHEIIAHSGGPRIFSGPIQPPSLGAAIGTASVLLSTEFQGMQARLIANISAARSIFEAYGIDFSSQGKSPIFYIRIGGLDRVIDLCHCLYGQGYYVVPVGFPAVNHNDEGVRVCVTRLHTVSEMDGLAHAIAGWSRRNRADRRAGVAESSVMH